MVASAAMDLSEEHLAVCYAIRQRRMDAGLSLRELAARGGISPNYLGTLERGFRDPCLSTLIQLATGLGITVGELFGPKILLSELSLEMGRLFDQAPPYMQQSILIILRSVHHGRRAGGEVPRA